MVKAGKLKYTKIVIGISTNDIHQGGTLSYFRSRPTLANAWIRRRGLSFQKNVYRRIETKGGVSDRRSTRACSIGSQTPKRFDVSLFVVKDKTNDSATRRGVHKSRIQSPTGVRPIIYPNHAVHGHNIVQCKPNLLGKGAYVRRIVSISDRNERTSCSKQTGVGQYGRQSNGYERERVVLGSSNDVERSERAHPRTRRQNIRLGEHAPTHV